MSKSASALIGAILVGGIAAGALDFVAACLIYEAPPEIIGKAIAAGVLGPKASFAGGLENSVLGAALHFGISIVAAAVFVFASLPLTLLRSRAILAGVAFGVAVFFFMNFLVVPNSLAATGKPFDWTMKKFDLVAHAFFFGPAVSIAAQRFLGKD